MAKKSGGGVASEKNVGVKKTGRRVDIGGSQYPQHHLKFVGSVV